MKMTLKAAYKHIIKYKIEYYPELLHYTNYDLELLARMLARGDFNNITEANEELKKLLDSVREANKQDQEAAAHG